jgi:DNA-binding Xre family transcriptional regulator
MAITYKPLWKLLIDKGIKKGELCRIAQLAPATITKMGKGAHISTETIEKICLALDCEIADIMEIVKQEGI